MPNKGYRMLTASVLLCTVSAAFAVFFILPEKIRLSSTAEPASSWRLLLITLLPLFPIFLFSQKGTGKRLCILMTVLIEAYAFFIILSNLEIFALNYPVTFHLLTSLILVFEAMHLKTNKNRNSRIAISFKWIDDYPSWLEVQKKGFWTTTALAAVQIINTGTYIFGIYSFKTSAIITAAGFYLAILILFRLAKPDQKSVS